MLHSVIQYVKSQRHSFKQKIWLFLSQFPYAQKKQIKALLIHMCISVYGVMWSGLHGGEAKLFVNYFYIYAYNFFQDFDMAEHYVGDTSLKI